MMNPADPVGLFCLSGSNAKQISEAWWQAFSSEATCLQCAAAYRHGGIVVALRLWGAANWCGRIGVYGRGHHSRGELRNAALVDLQSGG